MEKHTFNSVVSFLSSVQFVDSLDLRESFTRHPTRGVSYLTALWCRSEESSQQSCGRCFHGDTHAETAVSRCVTVRPVPTQAARSRYPCSLEASIGRSCICAKHLTKVRRNFAHAFKRCPSRPSFPLNLLYDGCPQTKCPRRRRSLSVLIQVVQATYDLGRVLKYRPREETSNWVT